MLRKKKFLIGGIVILAAIAYVGFVGFQSSATYYYTVSELVERASLSYDETVKVNGKVAPGSVEQGSAGRLLKFTIVDAEKEASLPVVYQGVIPDTFKEGNEVVAEGHLESSGTFQAHNIMVKCPSKYEPEELD